MRSLVLFVGVALRQNFDIASGIGTRLGASNAPLLGLVCKLTIVVRVGDHGLLACDC